MLKTVSSIVNAIGALNYKGTWDANANSPALASSVGTKGDYYVVGTAGSTNLNGISNWGIGDWAAFNGSVWQRVEGGANLNGVDLSVSGTSTLSGLTASTALALNASKEVISVTNTGTGNNVLANSPTLVTPNIGDATGTQLNIDNLRLDGNTISSQNTNGVINLLPNGTTGDVRATTRLRFQSNAQNSDGALASYRVSLSTVATDISAYDGTWGHLAIVTGLSTVGGNFFTDLVFSSATAGPTVLSSKIVSGAPSARIYSMSGASKLQLAMVIDTYDVRTAILYGLQ